MNRRTKRRLIVLAALGGAVVLAGVGGTTIRNMRRAHMAETARAEGLAAYHAKDYITARDNLRTHLRIMGPEAEPLTALGDAQRYIEAPNGRHLINARTYLEQAVLLDPQNAKARDILLEIHEQLGNWLEMAHVASDLLEMQPDNHRVARLLIRANLNRGAEAEALAAAQELVKAQDGHIEAHVEMLRVMQRSGRNAREQRAYVEAQAAPQHAGTTSLAVLRATVEYDAGQPQRAIEIILQAGEAGATDGMGARMLLESLELISAATGNVDLFDRSQNWLTQWLEQEALAPHLFEIAAGRAWRRGLPQRAVDLATRAMDGEPTSESVFGWGLLGAMEMGLEGENITARLREAFDNATDEEHANRAERWRQMIEAAARSVRGQSPSDDPLLPLGLEGINTFGPDGVGGYYDAINDASRSNMRDARDRLIALGQYPSWRRARFTLAGILLGENRPREALTVLRSDQSLLELNGGLELFGDAIASVIEVSGNPTAETARVLDDELARKPENPVLLAAVGRGALARGDTSRAVEMAQRLAQAEAARAAVSAVRFAANLQAVDVGLARAIVDRIALTATTPREIAAAAMGLANLGQAQQAREILEREAQKAGGASSHEWNLARIQLANTIADAQSIEALEQLSGANASDPRIHIEILNSTAIWADPDRAGQVIARLRKVQGEEGIDWRIFEARRLLEGNDSTEAATAAAGLLTQVFESDRGKRDTRAMLIAADAFERAGPVESELRALGFAADGNDPAAALPRLIDRLQSLGRSTEAATRLRQFVEFGGVPTESRAMRVQLLLRQGMQDLATQDIAALAAEGYPQYILWAGVLARPRGTSVPLTEAERLALAADLAPQGRVYAAQLLARVGRFDEGLARLESLPTSSDAGARAIVIARYMNDEGRPDEALAFLTEHAENANDADAWMEAARLLVGQNRVDEAAALLERASASVPGNAAIASFRASIAMDGEASSFDRMVRFAASSADREDATESMQELGAIAKRYVGGQIDVAQVATQLDVLSKQRATFYPLWPILVAAYEDLGQPNEAARRARDAVTAMPADARPARDATLLFLKLERYEEALGMAGQWRSLATDDENRAEADLALGLAEYRRGNTDRAIGLLQPRLARMMAHPDSHREPLRTLAEALSVADRMQEAEDLMLPLARNDDDWAAFMASMASVAPGTPANTERAVRWLETVTPWLTDDSRGTSFVASSWMTLYGRTQDQAFADKVIKLAQAAEREGADSWPLQATLATALEALDEFSPAVAAYERSLLMAGTKVPALLNNAAWVLTTELGEHQRAVAMARDAVALSNTPEYRRADRAVFHHTLGVALLASGDAAAALRVFDEGLQLADTTSLRLGRVEALLGADRRTEAVQAFGRLSPDDGWTAANRSRHEALGKILGSG